MTEIRVGQLWKRTALYTTYVLSGVTYGTVVETTSNDATLAMCDHNGRMRSWCVPFRFLRTGRANAHVIYELVADVPGPPVTLE